MARSAVLIKSEISEADVVDAINRYLGWISPRTGDLPFRMLSTDEQLTGADRTFNNGMLLYLQFKKSEGLTPWPGRNATVGTQVSSVIREFRWRMRLNDRPHFLYFKLRKKAKRATDFQHNILLAHEAWPSARAMYVAPLHLIGKDYEDDFERGVPQLIYPFHSIWVDRYIDSRTLATVRTAGVPFLRAHISIVPHCKVQTAEHHYSYSRDGGDVAFHSGELVDRANVGRLGEMLARTFEAVIDGKGMSLEGHVERIRNVLKDNSLLRAPTETEPAKFIAEHGLNLMNDWGIRQYWIGSLR